MPDEEDTTLPISVFLFSVLFQVLLGAILTTGFFIVYTWNDNMFEWILAPRSSYESQDKWPNPCDLEPPAVKPPNGADLKDWGRWIKEVWKFDDTLLMKWIGIDCTMILRLNKMCLNMFACLSFFGVLIVLPVNIWGDPEPEFSLAGDFNSLTMGNIQDNSSVFYIHVIFIYAMVLFVLWYINMELDVYRYYRHQYFLGKSRAVVTWPLPRTLDTPDRIHAFVAEYFEDQVESIVFARDTTLLRKYINDREKVECYYQRALIQETLVRVKWYMPWYTVKALPYYEKRAYDLDCKISELRTAVLRQPVKAAILTFRTLEQASLVPDYACQGVQMLQAPIACDMYWSSLTLGLHKRALWNVSIALIVTMLVAFYLIPITFVSSITTLANITDTFPFLEPLIDNTPIVRALLEKFLPSLSLLIFMGTLPKLLLWLTKLERFQISLSGLERGVFTKFFYFQFFNVFLASVVAGSLLNILDLLLENPKSLVELIALSLPDYSAFFINYVLASTFTFLPLKVMRVWPLFIKNVKRKWFCKTDIDIRSNEKPDEFHYGAELARLVIFCVIGFSYSALSPLILLSMTVYYFLAWIAFAFLVCHVYPTRFDSGAAFYPMVMSRIVLGIGVTLVFMMGYLALKSAPGPSAMLFPLLVITTVFYSTYIINRQLDFDHLSRDEITILSVESIPQDKYEELLGLQEAPCPS